MAEEKRTGLENIVRKFRIYPNKEQEVYFAKCFGCVRFVYNRMLAEKKAYYQETGKSIRITPAKYKTEFPWLKEVDSLALCNAQLHLEAAYKNFFRDVKAGFPKFKSKHASRESYTTNFIKGNIRIEGNTIRLPKVGAVKIKVHRKPEEDWILKSVTISRESTGRYYAAIHYQISCNENQVQEIDTENVLGMDFSMKGLAVFSDGNRADYPMFYRKTEQKLAREQRKLSRCRKGSRNYYKQKKKLAKVHAKVRNQRNDFQHKLSCTLAGQYDAVAVEDLNMRAMSQSLNFGKSTMDNGYGSFLEKLDYKLKRKGKRLIKIDRFYPSSKTCSCCGRVNKSLQLSDRTYICTCGYRIDRDVNAAINIRNEGKRILTAA